MNLFTLKRPAALLVTAAMLGSVLAGCTVMPAKPAAPGTNPVSTNAVNGRVPLVAPGEMDTHLGFWSAGPYGGVWVVGIPSMRVLREIPFFEARAGYGWGYDPASRELIQGTMPDPSKPSWGDTHHPMLSKTGGNYDGKYLYINDLANSRIAKIDLKLFKTVAIRRIPHIQGVHGIGVHADTKYVFATGEFEIPNAHNPGANEDNKYKTAITVLDKDLNIVAQVPVAYGNTDIMGTTLDGRYVFNTVYNTENGVDMRSMITAEKDAALFIDVLKVEEALAAGKFTEVDGVKVVDPEFPGLKTYVPVPKNPHGIDPDPTGKYVVASGKLSPTASIIDLATLKVVRDVELGAGPLHSAFDNRGNVYTGMFLDSSVVKWNLQEAVDGKPKETYIKQVEPAHYSPGHMMADGSGTKSPGGKWLVVPNKFSKDRFVNVGADYPENQQLFDISGDKMKLIMDMPIVPEPHDLAIAPADLFKDAVQAYDPKEAAHHDHNIEPVKEGETKIERDGNKVTVYTTAKRSEYGFKELKVKKGDHVTIYMTSLETVKDITHGFALPDYGINKAINPGETIKVEFTADKPGTYWAYCTWFCSALHLEMRSRIIIEE
ncbi:MAG TPA: cupredoxin domain-containing protein [Symbiobacteriaceae bacterium]|nr:cupredoxin domain-containing protein [Symbiobacteriaceae bacterium]